MEHHLKWSWSNRDERQFSRLRPGRHSVTYGPEGNIAGKPKHVKDFIFNNLPLGQNIDKSEVEFNVGGDLADVPTVDMYNGGVW